MSPDIYLSTIVIVFIFVQDSSGLWLKLQGDDVGNQASITETVAAAPLLPGSRSGSASWVDSRDLLWLFGGVGYDESLSNRPHHLNDLWQYNMSSKQWDLAHSGKASSGANLNGTRIVPKPRRGAVACGVPGILFVVFGGETYGKEKLFDTWLYRPENISWVPLLYAIEDPTHPPARSDASSWCMNDRLIIYGGVGRNGQLLEDLWQFSLRTLQWSILRQHGEVNTEGEMVLPGLRMGAAAWMNNNSLYLFGGSRDGETVALYLQLTESSLSDMWQYDLSSNKWSLLQHSSETGESDNQSGFPHGRLLAGSVYNSNTFYLFGGYGVDFEDSMEFLFDLWRYDKDTKLWTRVTATVEETGDSQHLMKPTPRCDATIWYFKGVLYVFGGFGFDKKNHISLLNDVYVNVEDKSRLVEFIPPSETYVDRFMRELPPHVIFAICFGSFGGMVLIFGAMFCMKKMIDFPNHGPIKMKNYNRKNVKYSRVEDDLSLDM